MKALKVFCNLGCAWSGELGSLSEHVHRHCPNALVPCPNSCDNSSKLVSRKNLENHLSNKCPKRRYTCQHCGEAGCYDERTTTHLEVCPMVKLQCSKCLQLIVRRDCQEHHLTCSHELTLCKYHKIGCKEKRLRKDLNEHEEDAQFHLAIATEKVLALTSQLMKNFVTFKMTNFKQHKEISRWFNGPPFSTSMEGYKLISIIIASGNGAGTGTHVSVFAYLTKGDNA